MPNPKCRICGKSAKLGSQQAKRYFVFVDICIECNKRQQEARLAASAMATLAMEKRRKEMGEVAFRKRQQEIARLPRKKKAKKVINR